jgi:hypothetical protein
MDGIGKSTIVTWVSAALLAVMGGLLIYKGQNEAGMAIISLAAGLVGIDLKAQRTAAQVDQNHAETLAAIDANHAEIKGHLTDLRTSTSPPPSPAPPVDPSAPVGPVVRPFDGTNYRY